MSWMRLKNIEFRAGWRTAVVAGAMLGVSLAAVAQNDADPAAQNVATVAASAAPASKTIPDAQVEANVLSALAGEASLADQPISTTTTYGVVTLSGTVKDDASKKLAAQVASTSPGVQKVVDQLTVGDIGEAAAQPAPEGAAPLPSAAPAADDANAQQQTEQGMNGQAPEQPGVEQQQAQQPYPGQMQQPGGYPPPPPGYRPQPYPGYAAEGGPAYSQGVQYPSQTGGKHVVVPAGRHIQIRVSQGMDGKHTPVGTVFNGILMNDVIADGAIALPRDAEVQGTVVDAKSAGGLTGSGALALQLTGISFGGQQYPLQTAVWGINGPSKTGNTVGNTVGLGLLGAFIGAAAGGGPGAAIGAVAGGGAGLAASAGSQGPQAFVRPESLLNFTTSAPVKVTTVGQDELNRLASAAPAPRGYPPPPPGYYHRRYYRPYYYPYGYPY